jgi:tetratricopeptide (TPR) repeat protein
MTKFFLMHSGSAPWASSVVRLRNGLCGRLLMLALLAFAATPATAQKPDNLTAGEIALLPLYCADTMGLRPGASSDSMGPGAAQWFRLMGKAFQAMHHHCWALINEGRAMRAGVAPAQREGLLNRVVADNQFVIANAPPDFIMLPDIYTKIGDAYALLLRPAQAIEAYTEALRRKPDYWRPYSRWANLLAANRDRKGALTVLETGLRAVPPEKTLRAQYKQLGGDIDKFLRTLPPPPVAAASAPASAPDPALAPALPAAAASAKAD